MKIREDCFWFNRGTCEFFEGLEDLCRESTPCVGPDECGDYYQPLDEDEDEDKEEGEEDSGSPLWKRD